jgi:predicted MFS family arabinose efflux permease
LLIVGFAALPLRGAFFIFVTSPYLLVAVQLLDGISAAVMGVMLPLVVADATRGSGHFNAALGVVGTAGAIGASLSTTLAGYVSDSFGNTAAFVCLAGIAAAGALMVAGLMPETRPTRD